MGTFYPVKVEINPANLPGSTGSIPIWNGSIFELLPVGGNFLQYSEEPSILIGYNFIITSASTWIQLDAPYQLDNSALNSCQPASNPITYDSFYLSYDGWVKFTYSFNVDDGGGGNLFEMRVIHDNGTANTVLDDALGTTPALPFNMYGVIYVYVASGDIIYLEIYIDSIVNDPIITNYSLTCTNVNFSF